MLSKVHFVSRFGNASHGNCRLLGKSARRLTSNRFYSGKDGDEMDNDLSRFKVPGAGTYRSPWIIMKEEVKSVTGAFTSGVITPAQNKIPREADCLIIGGGVVGNACAYWLKKRNPKGINVTIVERDYGYTRAATMLSAGGIRHQFSIPENIQMSMFSTDFLRNIREHLSVLDHEPPDIQFNHAGYLFLAAPNKAQDLEKCVKVQKDLGAKIDLMSKERLAEKFPWINLDGIEVGSYGLQGEGWFDPWLLIKALRQKNVNNEVLYTKGEVVGFTKTKIPASMTGEDKDRDEISFVEIQDENGDLHQMKFSFVINCAGPWAGEIAKMAGIGTGKGSLAIPLPVEPRKRFIYVLHCHNGPGLEAPLTVEPSGVYFRREGLGGHYICGSSPAEGKEPDCSNLDVDYEFFDECIWPKLAHRYPQFEKIKLKSAWAGYYDYNYVDQNLIIGPHPEYKNFWFANGMSGHGLQQSLAIGRALSELMHENEFTSIDLSRFSFDRFLLDEPVKEEFIV